MFHYIHPQCGAAAFTATQKPTAGEAMSSKGMFHLDGRPIEFCSEVVCDSCGKPMRGMSVKNFVLASPAESFQEA